MSSDALFQLGMDLDHGSSTAQTEEKLSRCTLSEGDGHKDFFCERDGVRFAGTHLIIDLVRAERLDDLEHIEHTLRRCVEVAGATLLHIHLHHFTPNGGVSGVAVLAESHISIHSWPEYGYAALDVFMCGQTNPRAAIDVLKEAFSPRQGGGQGAYAREGNATMERWVEETLHRGFRVRLKADRVLFDSETEHQRLIIFDNADFGRVMMLDNIVQLTTKDEFVYHEMMAHVPLVRPWTGEQGADRRRRRRRRAARGAQASRAGAGDAVRDRPQASSISAASISPTSRPAPMTTRAPGSSLPTAPNSWRRPMIAST